MSEDAHNSNNFNSQTWANGELCPQHGAMYCTPCLQAALGVKRQLLEPSESAMDRMRSEISKRIRAGETQHEAFHRPEKRNFFEDSRRRQFAATCQLGEGNHIFMRLAFVIIGDDTQAWKANDEETRAILRNEHIWDGATPAWAQNFVPDISFEDATLLREMQLFY